jgi:heme/copper-type cytochrome/quinol oxidase subunit 3
MLTAFPIAMSCSFASLIVSEIMLFGTLLMCSFTMTAGASNGIHTIVSSLSRTPFILTLVLCMLGVAMCFNMYYFLFFHRNPAASAMIISVCIVMFLALSASEYTTVPLYYNTQYAALLSFTVVSIHLSHVLLCLSLYMTVEALPIIPLLFPFCLFILGKKHKIIVIL